MSASEEKKLSRRDFITTGAAAATALGAFPFVNTARAQMGDKLRVGAIGTGGRGTGACANAIEAGKGSVDLVGMADIVPEAMESALNTLKNEARELQGELQANIKVTPDTMFSGDEGWKKLLDMDLDYVILTTPPGFRPLHYQEAVKRGLHVFAEKPVATDPVGCRKVRAAAEQARSKGLSVVVGLQTRYSPGAQDVVKRIHDGAVGEPVAGNIWRLGGGLWHRGSDPSWSDMEYQCRNWYYFVWLSGDQITEMVVHQVDLMNWALGAHPVSALANGGRQVRTDPKYGNIYDHMSVDFEYPNDVHVTCMLRQIANCENKNDNLVVGTIGTSDSRQTIRGQNRYRHRDDRTSNPTVIEHEVLQDSIRNNKAINNMLDYAVDSTLSTIMGRESAYTGKLITWDEMLNSDLDLFPADYHFGSGAPQRPVAMPGQPRPV